MKLLFIVLYVFVLPVCARDHCDDLRGELEAMRVRALTAELRAAVAEERLLSIPHQQATEKTLAAFRASCEAQGIKVEDCEPTENWGVKHKVKSQDPKKQVP